MKGVKVVVVVVWGGGVRVGETRIHQEFGGWGG